MADERHSPAALRLALLHDLDLLERNLRRLGAAPLVDHDVAEALDVDDLRRAVATTAAHLIDLAAALGESTRYRRGRPAG